MHGISAVRLEYSVDAVRHSIIKVANFVQSNSLPLLPDGLTKFSYAAWARKTTLDTLFYEVPNVFYWIEVRAAGRPLHKHKPTST